MQALDDRFALLVREGAAGPDDWPGCAAGAAKVARAGKARHHDRTLPLSVALRHSDAVARARVVRVAIPLPIRHPEEVVEAFIAGVSPRTRLALVSHVTSPSGLVLPIESIVRELGRMGVDTLVDAAHAPGMVPVDLDALGAAYWTGNGHKWLCGPKGTGMLWVRADRRDAIHPLVVSHGANADLEGRTRFRHEFDWVGTADPTGYLALPAAIDWMRDNAAPDGGGWPAVMAANRALAIEGRDRVAAALDVAPPAPDSMLGSMATLPLEAVPDEAAARSLGETLERSDRIQVPVGPWPVRSARNGEAAARMTIRLSAQRYNEPEDYDRLADALRRHLGDPRRAEP